MSPSTLLAAGARYLQGDLEEVERVLAEKLVSSVPVVSDLGRYLVESGGKRFRPALVLLFYKLLGERGDKKDAVELAAVVEMIHLATLAHDDVLDEAPERRGRASLWKLSGSQIAVLEGDFIFSRAFRLLNRQPFPIRERIIEAVEEVLEGELLQESLRGQVPTEDEYERVIRGKTGALIRAACAVGALVGDPDLPEERLVSIERAGLLLGMAYQMIDDLLDVFGDEALGKPRGIDQRGGWLTWPYLRLLKRTGDPQLREKLREPLPEPQRQEFVAQMVRLGIREEFAERARALVEEAKEQLSWLADSPLKAVLFQGFDFVIERDR